MILQKQVENATLSITKGFYLRTDHDEKPKH